MDLFRKKTKVSYEVYESKEEECKKRARKIDNVYKIAACVLGAIWLLSIVKPVDIKFKLNFKSLKNLTYIFNEKRGNTIGNDSNGSIAVKKGNYIYYVNFEDDNKIYRAKSDGSTGEKFLEDNAGYLNIIGNELYYLNKSDGGKIYKVNLKSKEKSKVSNEAGGKMVISGGLIYYIKMPPEYMGNPYRLRGGNSIADEKDFFCIFRMKLNGKDKKKITGESNFFNVYNGRIYYINSQDGNRLYRINKDGSDKKRLLDEELWRFWMDGEYIYYQGASTGDGLQCVYRVKHDGNEKVKLIIDDICAINTSNDYMYYSSSIGLHKGDVDGKKSKRIVASENYGRLFDMISVVGDWVYCGSYYHGLLKINNLTDKYEEEPEVPKKIFAKDVKGEDVGTNFGRINKFGWEPIFVNKDWSYYANNGKLYKFKNGGNNGEIVIDCFDGNNVMVNNGYIYYVNYFDNNKVYRVKEDGNNKGVFFNEKVSSFLIKGDYLYYSKIRDENGIYRIKLDGSDNRKLINKPFNSIYFTKNNIIYSSYDGKIYRTSLEGENEEVIGNSSGAFLVLWGNYIYYGYDGIYKTDLRDKSTKKIYEGNCSILGACDEYIYFTNEIDNRSFYRINNDGSSKIKLMERPVNWVMPVGEYIYYQDSEGGAVMRARKDGSEEVLIDNFISKISHD